MKKILTGGLTATALVLFAASAFAQCADKKPQASLTPSQIAAQTVEVALLGIQPAQTPRPQVSTPAPSSTPTK